MHYCALLDASTNPDIARLFYTKSFRGILESAQGLQQGQKRYSTAKMTSEKSVSIRRGVVKHRWRVPWRRPICERYWFGGDIAWHVVELHDNTRRAFVGCPECAVTGVQSYGTLWDAAPL